MDVESLLLTHAELALGLAGFASVVAALGRPLSPVQRQRFLNLLSIALTQVLLCVMPVWLFSFIESTPTIWRLASALYLLLAVATMIWVVILPIRALDGVFVLVNPTITLLVNVASGFAFLALLLNTLGLPLQPNFPMYYSALAVNLFIGFIVFADVVVGRSSAD